MPTSNLDLIRSMYDERGERYDESNVHVKQAQDYIRWAELKQGENVLDLACGTGLVALSAKQQVKDGLVVGVDISEGMLNVAREKAKADSSEVQFINHDISDLSGVDLPGFDIITCASALVLLEDPFKAVKNWASLLRPGGRLITDVQTKDANIAMNILAAIGPEVGESLPWRTQRWQSEKDLEKVVSEAGLTVREVWETGAYATQRFAATEGGELFEQSVSRSMFRNFAKDTIRGKAKQLFVQKFKELAGPSDVIEEETKFWTVIAEKQS